VFLQEQDRDDDLLELFGVTPTSHPPTSDPLLEADMPRANNVPDERVRAASTPGEVFSLTCGVC